MSAASRPMPKATQRKLDALRAACEARPEHRPAAPVVCPIFGNAPPLLAQASARLAEALAAPAKPLATGIPASLVETQEDGVKKGFLGALLRLKEQLGVQTDRDAAETLGLSDKALNARKARGAFPEDRLFALAAKRPDLRIDVGYVLSGRRPEPALSKDLVVAAEPAAVTRVTGEELERRQRVHAAMQLAGVSVAAWAKAHGFNHQIVAGVLAGRFTGTRGEAHSVCVALKLKSGPQALAPADFDAAAVLGESTDAEGGAA